MTVDRKLAIARGTLWASAGFNLILTVVNVWQHQYAAAAWDAIIVTGTVSWIPIAAKIDARMDAKIQEAVAQQRMAELALAEMERARDEMRVRVSIAGPTARPS